MIMDDQEIFTVSGNGDVLEGDGGIAAVGSGAPYALAAGRALLTHTDMSAAQICRAGLEMAAEICIYTNDHITVHELEETSS